MSPARIRFQFHHGANVILTYEENDEVKN